MFWNWSIDGEADAIFAKAAAEHDQKQKANEAWGIRGHSRWDLELNVGELRLGFGDGRIATAPVQVVGSFDESDQTWQWSWDNPSINRLLTQDAKLCRDFGERHKLPPYTKPLFSCSEEDAYGFTALALHLAGAAGAFRSPGGPLSVFVIFGEVTIQKIN